MFSSTRICTSRAEGTFWKDLFAKAWKMDRLGYPHRKMLVKHPNKRS